MRRRVQGFTPLKRERGLSIVELLVGVAVGLFIVGGATKLFVDYLIGTRNSLVEVRLQQELRAAADLVARDLRRAGYWRSATTGVWSATTTTIATNPYNVITTPTNEIVYSYDKGSGASAPSAAEIAGFRLVASTGVLEANLGSTYQPITDPATANVTAFTVTTTALNPVELYQTCPCLTKGSCTLAMFQPAAASAPAGSRWLTRPVLSIQQYTIKIAGESRVDSRVKREITETVRVRNDKFTGDACVN